MTNKLKCVVPLHKCRLKVSYFLVYYREKYFFLTTCSFHLCTSQYQTRCINQSCLKFPHYVAPSGGNRGNNESSSALKSWDASTFNGI